MSTALLFVPRMLGAAIIGGGDGSLPSQELVTLAGELGRYGGGITWLPMCIAMTALVPPANAETTPGFIEGTEFQVNTHTADHQANPSVSVYSKGLVMVWESLNQDGSGYGVFGQRYSPTGMAVGGEFRINDNTPNDQRFPDVAPLGAGFVVVWGSTAQSGNGDAVYGRRFNEDGVPSEGEFMVNTGDSNNQKWPKVCETNNGFVVVWQNVIVDDTPGSASGQRFDGDGNKVGNEFLVSSSILTNGRALDVLPHGDGFFTIWSSYNLDGDGAGVHGQLYDSSGAPQGVVQVNSFTTGDQQFVGAASNGSSFMVVWNSQQDGSGWGVYGRSLDASASPVGSVFQVNMYYDDHQSWPAALSLDDSYLSLWQSRGQDGDDYGIYARWVNVTGSFAGDEFRINTRTTGDQGRLSAASLEAGFVVVWEDLNRDGSGESIFAKVYTAITEAPTPAPPTFVGSPAVTQFSTAMPGGATTSSTPKMDLGATEPPEEGSDLAAIIGGAVGGTIGLGTIGACLYYCGAFGRDTYFQRRKDRREERVAEAEIAARTAEARKHSHSMERAQVDPT